MARGADCEIQKVSLPPFSPGCEQGTSGPRGEWQPVLSGPALWQWQSGDKEKGWEEGLENWSLRFPPEPSGGQSHLVALGLAQDGSCMVAGWGCQERSRFLRPEEVDRWPGPPLALHFEGRVKSELSWLLFLFFFFFLSFFVFFTEASSVTGWLPT